MAPMRHHRRARKGHSARKAHSAPAKPLSKVQRKQVKAIVKGQAETKRSIWFQDYNNGTVSTRATGLFGTRGFATQNSVITNNETDILRLIPNVAQGIDTYTRIGDRINPIGLNVKGTIRVNQNRFNVLAGTDIDVYIYVLQHVSLKDYAGLYARNDWTQLLDLGQGLTKKFSGEETDPKLPVASQYYKVIHRKKVTLRYGGSVYNGTTPPEASNYVALANSHTWHGDYSMSLGKYLPKTLKYPEPGADPNPVVTASPTNSSLFMCMGFVNWYAPSNWTASSSVYSYIEQTYTAELLYKDT